MKGMINAAAGLLLVHVLCTVLLCLAGFCNPAFVRRIKNFAARLLLLLVHVLRAVLLCFAKFCNPMFVNRIIGIGSERDELRRVEPERNDEKGWSIEAAKDDFRKVEKDWVRTG